MRARTLGAIMAAAAIGCVAWGAPSPTVASGIAIRADEQAPSVEDAEADLDTARAELEAAQQAEQEAQQRAERASQAAADAATAAKEAAARAERARNQHAEAEQAVEGSREELGRLAAYAYANNAEIGQLAELGAAIDPAEFQSRSTGLSELMRVQETLVHQAAESRADAANAASRAIGQAEAAAAASEEAAVLSEAARSALAEASSATEQAEAALQEVREIHAAARRAAEERAAAERSPDRSERGNGSTDVAQPDGDGVFVRPSTGRITSPYGMRVHPVTGVYKLHSGTDFAASCGAGVNAAYGGTVESTGYEGAYGNRITISHGDIGGIDVTTTYNHLSGFSVRPGQSVATGESIGQVGTTGSSTGCHLHFEVLVNGQFTNPMAWLS